MNKTANIVVKVEAVQGNAETVDEWNGSADTAWFLEDTTATEYVLETAEEFAQKYNIPILEDAAEALGSQYKGKMCGTLGNYGALSFNGNKIITTSGGGALICPNEEKMKILVAGDFCPIERTASIIEEGKFDQIFKDVKHLTSTVDYSIVNLECPIIHENAIPIVKCGPNLRCSRKVIDALCYSGFGCTTLANNHFRDFGDNGCLTTISELKKFAKQYCAEKS